MCRVCKKREATVMLGGFMATGPVTERGLLGEQIERLCGECYTARVTSHFDQALEAFKHFTDGPR